MGKELQKVTNRYISILEKVGIIVGAVTKIAQSYSSMLPKRDAQAELEMKHFGHIDALLG